MSLRDEIADMRSNIALGLALDAWVRVRPAQLAKVLDALDKMEKALRDADQFITNGIELGYIKMPDSDTPDSAHKTPAIVRAALRALEE